MNDQHKQLPNFQFIDLFAGIGGLRTAFEKSGGRCVFTSEWDKYSQQTYGVNFPDNREIQGDITQIDVSLFGRSMAEVYTC